MNSIKCSLDPDQGLNGCLKGLKVGIVGSREYPNEDQVKLLVSLLPSDAEVVSGGQALGVDGWAKKYALLKGLKYTEFVPMHYHGAPYDVGNYHKRNHQIAEYSDIVFAFMHKPSRGTQSTVNFCIELATPVIVVNPETDVSAAVDEIYGVKKMLENKVFDKEAPADELGSSVKAQNMNGQSSVKICEVKDMKEKSSVEKYCQDTYGVSAAYMKYVEFCKKCGKQTVATDYCEECLRKAEEEDPLPPLTAENTAPDDTMEAFTEEMLVCPFCGKTERTGICFNDESFPVFPVPECDCGAKFFYDHAPAQVVQEKLECSEVRDISGFELEGLYPIAQKFNNKNIHQPSSLAAVSGDIIEIESDNGMLIIDNQTGHTYGFLGHKTPVLVSVDGKGAFGLKHIVEAHNDGSGLWEGYMDDKDLFRQLVRIGIVYSNAGRWHINQPKVAMVGDELIHNWNAYNLPGHVTCTGDPRHAMNKLHYYIRKRKEWEQNKQNRVFEPPKKGTYWWYKQNLVSAYLVEVPILPLTKEMITRIMMAKRTPIFMREPLENESIFKCKMKTGETEYITVYKGAMFSRKNTDYVWTAKFLKELAKKDTYHKPEDKHDTQGQKDCWSKNVNKYVWQPSRSEVFTEITGADVLNEKLRNSRKSNSSDADDTLTSSEENNNDALDMVEDRRIKKKLRKDRNVPSVTNEEIILLRELRETGRRNIYRYMEQQKQAQKIGQDNRTELEKTYDQAFDKIFGRKKSPIF